MLKKFFTLALMLAALLVSSTTFAFSIYHPADGIYSIQPKCAPGKELSVQNHAGNWGANVIIDNISPNWRKWKVQRVGNTDFYSIIAVHSNLALDVDGARAQNGANVATWPFLEGKQNQYIFWDAGGGYYVIQANIGGSFVLDVANGENRAGANVLSWSFGGGDNQKWKLVPVQSLPAFQSYQKTATQTVNAYVMPNLQSRSGNERVDRGDNVTVLREEGNAYLVRYPVSGGTKTRWVNKNEIFSDPNPTPSPTPAPSGGMLFPLKGSINVTPSSAKTKGYYCDYKATSNTPVYAPADGTVNFRQSYAVNYGKLASYGNNFIFTSSDGQYKVTCAHLNSFNNVSLKYNQSLSYPCSSSKYKCTTISLGTRNVRKGDLIGYTGMTGNASGPHIHIEVTKNGTPVDPRAVFTAW